MKKFLLFIFLFTVFLGSKALAVDDKQSKTTTLFSGSHAFVVQGFSGADAAVVAQWADEVKDKVESLVQKKIPFGGEHYIRIIASTNKSHKRGQVTKDQAYIDGTLQQELRLTNPNQVDQEDLLESLVWLLLNRYAIDGQTTLQRKNALARVPEWFSVGFAQNLYPQLRNRNREAGLTRWQCGEKLSWNKLTQMETMPAGRWGQKIDAALAIQWLLSFSDADVLIRSFFARIGQGALITPEWMAVDILKFSSLVDLEKNWDLWIAQQRSIYHESGSMNQDEIDQLKQLFSIYPDDYGVDVPDLEPPFTLRQLVGLREEKWLPVLVDRLAIKVKFAAVGRPPEYQAVIERYARFFDALQGKKSGYSGGVFGRKPSDSQLLVLLDEADQALFDLETRWTKQQKYLDQFEKQEERNNFLPL